jgi:hypothetical protein
MNIQGLCSDIEIIVLLKGELPQPSKMKWCLCLVRGLERGCFRKVMTGDWRGVDELESELSCKIRALMQEKFFLIVHISKLTKS